MENLRHLLEYSSKRRCARFWLGPRPEVRDSQLISAILQKIGYPAPGLTFDATHISNVPQSKASEILAFVVSRSLVWGIGKPPKSSAIAEAKSALKDLGEAAQFFSNGQWGATDTCGWNSVSSATFDAGLLGYDLSNAFIFWVEEED